MGGTDIESSPGDRLAILATDTHYTPALAVTAGVILGDWTDTEPLSTHIVERVDTVAEYQPGSFYLRELPGILALVESLPWKLTTIVIDDYVYLDEQGRQGLGAHLFDELEQRVPVIGVAKRPFAGSTHAVAVHQGKSKHPLYVTAAGIQVEPAAGYIHSMSGIHRQPTLLKAADRLCRERMD